MMEVTRLKQKMIFFDIDGTLLNHDKEIPDSTKYAIHQLKRQGHHIAIATGRGPFMFEWIRETLDIDTYISYNGQYVIEKDQVIFKNPLSTDVLMQLETLAREQEHPMGFMGHEKVTANVSSHSYLQESFSTLAIDPPPFDPHFHKEEEIYQALLFCRQSEDHQYREFQSPFDFIRWHQVAMDVIPKGGSKAKGIEQLIKHLNIDVNDTIAFGDALNDVDMLKYVGQGIAMGNGYDEAKQAANLVTKHVNEDGIYYGLKDIGLI